MSKDYSVLMSNSFHVKQEHADRVISALDKTMFRPYIDDSGCITGIEADDYFYADEMLAVMKEIAPYVESGSYIEVANDEIWRWVFQDGVCHEIVPELLWMPPGTGSRKITIVIEDGMVVSVLTNDPTISSVDVLDRDNMACAEGDELRFLRELERKIKTGSASGSLREIF